MKLNARQRLLKAIINQTPDRLPVTTHHVMQYFLDRYLDGKSVEEFFEHFHLDPILWTGPMKPFENENWVVTQEEVPNPEYKTVRYTIQTPKGTLTAEIQSNDITPWLSEHLIKDKKDIELLAEYQPLPELDVEELNRQAEACADKALIRGHIVSYEIYGQPGCWQDAACLYGIEPLIMATYDDPGWVRQLLDILLERKKHFIRSLKGAKYDILELGGGDASSTVISPKVFDEYVAPWDRQLVDLAHEMGQKIVYHTCGGMMPLLERIADMGVDAMETFTPRDMGGDSNLAEAKRRIGDRVCMIGGFDQGHFFKDCTEEQTREQVRKCFKEAGQGGGFILSPSDHFFDADPHLIAAFADEARRCVYG